MILDLHMQDSGISFSGLKGNIHPHKETNKHEKAAKKKYDRDCQSWKTIAIPLNFNCYATVKKIKLTKD